MADEQTQIGNVHEVTARGGKGVNGGASAGAGFNDADQLTINAMRARLTAISGTSYSAARLNQMTYNDMIYALRVHDAPTSI